MTENKSEELKLAEYVAEQTAARLAQQFRDDFQRELNERENELRRLWKADLGQLRDDLTAKSLLADIPRHVPSTDASEPIHVMVVDDYPEIRRAFVRTLTVAGMVVSSAEDGPSAATLLEKDHRVEVLIADVSMPKNGYTLLEHVRKHFPVIEVVMTSGIDTEVSKARKLGAFAFLPKPFQMQQAIMLVERAAEFRRYKLSATSKG